MDCLEHRGSTPLVSTILKGMIKNIKVLSRFEIINVLSEIDKCPFSEWHLISIYGWPFSPVLDEKRRKAAKKLGCLSTLALKFNDYTIDTYEKHKIKYPSSIKKIVLFDDDMAIKTINYLNKINALDGEHGLVVHCHAGVSRSGAIATFAADKYEINFWDEDVVPNTLVLQILQRNG